MTERQAILKTALPSHFLVKFHVDETLCVIPKKNLVDPTHLQVGGSCSVKWNATEVLEATIVAMGEKCEMMKAEKEQLMNIENQAEQQPPSKKKKTELSSKRGKGRKPLAPVQAVCLTSCIVNVKMTYLTLYIIILSYL